MSADYEGRYSLSGFPGGRYSLSAIAEGYALQANDNGLPRELTSERVEIVDFYLSRDGVRLSGVIVDGTGGVIPDAQVQFLYLDSHRRVATTVAANEQGGFQALVSAGPILISASAEGYARASMRIVAPTSSVQLVLLPSASIRGVVLNARTREPLEAVEVRVVARFATQSLAQAGMSDENGDFFVDGLTPGRYSVAAVSESGRGEASGEINLAPGQAVRDVEVLMEPAVSVSGRVERDVGGTCERGFMTLGPPQPSFTTLPETSKADKNVPSLFSEIGPRGAVSFRGALPGVYQATLQCADHVMSGGPLDVEVGVTSLSGLRWVVSAGIGIRVRVVDDRLHPVPHARFFLEWPSNDKRRGRMGLETDGDGLYQSPRNLTPGEYRLLAVGRPEVTTVHVERGQSMAEAKLQLEGSGSITVEVRDDAAKPLNGLQISARREGDSGDSIAGIARGDGRYLIGPLPNGVYSVIAEDGINPARHTEEAQAKAVSVTSGNNSSIKLELPRSGVLRGKVLDKAGSPLANAWVSTRAANAPLNSPLNAPRVLTDSAGEFELPGLARDALYDVTVAPPVGPETHHPAVSIATEVELRAEAPHSALLR